MRAAVLPPWVLVAVALAPAVCASAPRTTAPSTPARGEWGRYVRVAGPSPAAAGFDLVVSPGGRAVAAWLVRGGVQAATRPRGGRWAPPVTIASTGVLSERIGLAASGDGATVAAFWQTVTGLEMALLRPDGSWTAPFVVAPGTTWAAVRAVIAPDGAITVVGTVADAGAYTVQTTTRSAAGEWTPPMAIGRTATPDPALGVSAAGAVTAAWVVSRGLAVAVRSAGGTWGSVQQVVDPLGYVRELQLGVAADGSATAVWTADVHRRVRAVRRSATGRWGQPRSLATTGAAPEVGVASNGAATVVWYAFVRPHWRAIRSAWHPLGGSWSGAVALAPLARYATLPQVAVSSVGVATVGWTATRGNAASTWSVFTARRSSCGRWATATSLSPPLPLHGWFGVWGAGPAVAAGASGEATAIWLVQGALYSSERPG